MKKIEIKQFDKIKDITNSDIKIYNINALTEDKKSVSHKTILQSSSIHIIINNINNKQLVFSKQIRIPVLLNDNTNNGITVELFSFDINDTLPLKEIVKKEILDKCKYNVNIEDIKYLKTLKKSVDLSGSEENLFYIEVTNDMLINNNLEFNNYDIIYVNYLELDNYFFKDNIHTNSITAFGVQKFLNHLLIQKSLKEYKKFF